MAITTKQIQKSSISPGRRWASRPRPRVNVTVPYLQDHLERGIITQRDQLLLFLLADCPVMSFDQIKRLYWPETSQQACRRRLRTLYDMHYLDRTRNVSGGMSEIGIKPGLVYTLGIAGRLWLHKFHDYPKITIYPLANSHLILHDLGLTESMVAVTLEMRDKEHAIIQWHGEMSARMVDSDEKKVLLEPDALMKLTYLSRAGSEETVAYFVEWDTGTERGISFIRKVRRYDILRGREKLWQSKGLTRFPAVMVMTSTARRADNLAETILAQRQTDVTWVVGDKESFWQNPTGNLWRVVLPKKDKILTNKPIFPGDMA